MAFQKTKAEVGFSANYWKVHSIDSMNLDNTTLRVKMALYKDAATRTADETDIFKLYEIELNGDDFPLAIADQDVVSKNTSKLIYDKLKTVGAVALNNNESDTEDFGTDTTDV